ncbi:MAG: NAD(P)-dependent oxidoreductase [Fusicatenibacter sp.]
MALKVLHVGKAGNMERYAADPGLMDTIELVDLPMGLPAEQYLRCAADAQVIVADAMAAITKEVINGMPELKMIHSEGVGYNGIDLNAASGKRVFVCNCQGMNASAVAEQTILLMLGVLRDVKNGDQAVYDGNQIIKKENYMKQGNLLELADCQVGLIGFGDIAKSLAKLLNAFHAKVYYYKRTPETKETEKEYGASYLLLDELLSTCNMISMHVPATENTYHMANDAFFEKMQDGSYFINTARGEVADSAAIVRALKSGKLAMAGLDTLEFEPVQTDHILVNQPEEIQRKLLFSPHIGGITASSFRRGYAMIWKAIRDVADGKTPLHVVNRF